MVEKTHVERLSDDAILFPIKEKIKLSSVGVCLCVRRSSVRGFIVGYLAQKHKTKPLCIVQYCQLAEDFFFLGNP